MSFTVSYNNITDKSVGCHAKERPSIPAPTPDVQAVSIPGRDGRYFYSEGTYSDIVIPITFSFLDWNPDNWNERYRAIKTWALRTQTGELRFSDDPDVHYRVKSVRISSSSRVTQRLGLVTIEFTCDGYAYLNSGDAYIQLAATIENPYDLCKPIYRITRNTSSQYGILTVNSYLVRIDFVTTSLVVNAPIIIDSEQFVAYREDTGAMVNNMITGDYQRLWLPPGDNSFDITSGFSCELMPQWRCL